MSLNAFEFIATLPIKTFNHLYNDPWTCLGIFQSLTKLGKHFIMRILCIENEIIQESFILKNWIINDHKEATKECFESIKKLNQLHLFLPMKDGYVLNPIFQKNFKSALSNPLRKPWQNDKEINQNKIKRIPAKDIENFSRTSWDSVLHFMVGSEAVAEPPKSVTEILLRTKLMQTNILNNNKILHITDSGYEFMLKDRHEQIWFLLLEYIKTIDSYNNSNNNPELKQKNNLIVKKEDIMIFLFRLAFCTVNDFYSTILLDKKQTLLLTDFTNFGLLYYDRRNEVFYTTSLVVNIIYGWDTYIQPDINLRLDQANQYGSNLNQRGNYEDDKISGNENNSYTSNLSIIVETNFKVYAYTNDTLHVALLSVFVDIVARLPNMCVGFITRESLRSAFLHGISAKQIYNFLCKHAHTKMLRKNTIIPENIADQLYLWEREKNRMKSSEAVLFDGFQSSQDYKLVLDYAKDLNVLSWSNDKSLRLTIYLNGMENIRQFIEKKIVNNNNDTNGVRNYTRDGL